MRPYRAAEFEKAARRLVKLEAVSIDLSAIIVALDALKIAAAEARKRDESTEFLARMFTS